MNKTLKTKEINKQLNSIIFTLSNSSQANNQSKLKGKYLANIIRNEYIRKKNMYYLFQFEKKNLKKLKKNIILFSSLIGNPIGQNYKNEKYIEVTPDKIMIKKYKNSQDEKLRYHQTNKGGSIHTDGPQLKYPPRLIMLGCLNNEVRGGHTILVNGLKLYKILKKKFPKLTKILTDKFYFEQRGFSNKKDKFLWKSIFEIGKSFKIRYLNEYITTAYIKKKLTLSTNQKKALAILDKTLENKKMQKRLKMKRGNLILINNHVIAHGRTGFSLKTKKKRNLLRIWNS